MRRKRWRSERKRVPVRCCKIEADAKKNEGGGGGLSEGRLEIGLPVHTTRRRGREERKKRKKRVTCVEGRNVLEHDKREGRRRRETDRERRGEREREGREGAKQSSRNIH